MKRLLALLVAASTLLPACAGTQRPEGIVERWLMTLNQGAAGEPGRYATAEATAQLAPDWATREPGAYDEIHVGQAPRLTGGDGVVVPFRLVSTDRSVVNGAAVVGPDDQGAGDTLVRFVSTSSLRAVGTWPVSADASAWFVAVGAAVVMAALALLCVGVVRRSVRTVP